MRAVVFVNGKVEDCSALAAWLQPGDRLIGADGGTLHLLALGLTPHAVVGDLDSLPTATVEKLAAQGVAIERHPRAKDKTDLELAIDRAVADGADRVLLLGAMGGRLDQSVANLMLLAQPRWPAVIQLAEGNEIAQVLHGGQNLVLEDAIGSTLSVLPLSPEVTGVSYVGMEYPLENATLTLGSTRGVSNTVTASPAVVSIAAGTLLIIHTVGAALP